MMNDRSSSLQTQMSNGPIAVRPEAANLADILERVLDKGIVIAGDITINLLDIELLTIKLRLLIASVDKAQEMGINWWTSDPSLSTNARQLKEENEDLKERLGRLERMLEAPGPDREGSADATAERDQHDVREG
jgi:hypothetical protein